MLVRWRTHVHPVVKFEFKTRRYAVQILIPFKERLGRMGLGSFNMEYTGVAIVSRMNINEPISLVQEVFRSLPQLVGVWDP